MATISLPRPTDAELEILRVLWQRGACTVREVQESLNEAKPTGYTTVLKLMQIMTDKGLVRRDERQRAHVYEARLAQEQTQQQMVGDLLERVFNGSATSLVMQALATKKKTSTEELSEIRRIIDEFERGER
ncbi:MAG TPA: BlaI/MecI/CopY family transcriptional regulator [Blastocatellia bacterium]|nr:BlaI/MecI/CopY family transcriptional regulator [Blastocatellia bacterium]